MRESEIQLRAVTDYHLVLHNKEENPLQQLIGLIYTVINTVINLMVINTDSVHLGSSDLISLVALTHQHDFFL